MTFLRIQIENNKGKRDKQIQKKIIKERIFIVTVFLWVFVREDKKKIL